MKTIMEFIPFPKENDKLVLVLSCSSTDYYERFSPPFEVPKNHKIRVTLVRNYERREK